MGALGVVKTARIIANAKIKCKRFFYKKKDKEMVKHISLSETKTPVTLCV
jgi:hypothetical protein